MKRLVRILARSDISLYAGGKGGMVFDLTAGLIVLICVASALFGLFPWADQVPHLLLSCAGAVSGAVPCHLAYHAAGSSSNQKTLHKWGEQLAMSCFFTVPAYRLRYPRYRIARYGRGRLTCLWSPTSQL